MKHIDFKLWIGLVILSLVRTAYAQITWDGGGGDNNWSTGNNWVGNATPSNDGTAAIVFDGSTRTSPNVDTAWSVASITFPSTASAFTVGGSDLAPPSVAPGSMTDFVINNSANTQTINNNFATLENEAFNAASGNLVFGGNIATTGNGIDVKGSFNTTINGNITGDGFLYKDDGGTLTVNGSANSYTRNTFIGSGTFQVNGSLTSPLPTVSVFSGATLTGNGSIAGPVILGNTGGSGNNGTVAPGNGVGTLNAGSMTWNTHAIYQWQINKAGGTAGSNPGWDFLNISGGLTISATSSDPFTVQLVSLTLGGSPGTISDFNNSQSQSWRIATAGGGVTGFAANKFTIDTSQFQNSLNGGSFSVSLNVNDLNLNFTPVPEPGAWASVTALALFGLAMGRKLNRIGQGN